MSTRNFYFGSAIQEKVKRASQQARFSAIHNALTVVTESTIQSDKFEVMDLVYRQWKKIERAVCSIGQQLAQQTNLHNNINRQLAALAETDDLDQIQQLMKQDKDISNYCYVLAEKYLAGDCAFWAFKDTLLAAGKNPDTLKEVIANIKADPNWGMPALLTNAISSASNDTEQQKGLVMSSTSFATSKTYKLLQQKENEKSEATDYNPVDICPPASWYEEQAAAKKVVKEEKQTVVKEKKVQRSFFGVIVNAVNTIVTDVKKTVSKVINAVTNVVTATTRKVKNFFGLAGAAFNGIFGA